MMFSHVASRFFFFLRPIGIFFCFFFFFFFFTLSLFLAFFHFFYFPFYTHILLPPPFFPANLAPLVGQHIGIAALHEGNATKKILIFFFFLSRLFFFCEQYPFGQHVRAWRLFLRALPAGYYWALIWCDSLRASCCNFLGRKSTPSAPLNVSCARRLPPI